MHRLHRYLPSLYRPGLLRANLRAMSGVPEARPPTPPGAKPVSKSAGKLSDHWRTDEQIVLNVYRKEEG